MADDDVEDPDRHVEFSYGEEDYRAMLRWYHWVHKRAWTFRTITIFALILFGTGAAVFLFFLWIDGRPWPTGPTAVVGAVAGLVAAFGVASLVFVVSLRRHATRIHDRSEHGEIPPGEVRLTEAGVELHHGEDATKIGWEAFEAVETTDDFVFLVIGAEQAIGVPTRAFRDAAHLRAFSESAHRLWRARRTAP